MMVGISERLRSERLPYSGYDDRRTAARHARRGGGFDGLERHWAASALPLVSRWLVAATKDRLAKANDFTPNQIGAGADSAHRGALAPALRKAS